MRADRIQYRVYIIQAYLAVDPRDPQWSDVSHWAVAGYKRWKGHEHRVGTLGEQFFSDVLAFTDVGTAVEALKAARHDPLHQISDGHGGKRTIERDKYRLMQRDVLMTQREVDQALVLGT